MVVSLRRSACKDYAFERVLRVRAVLLVPDRSEVGAVLIAGVDTPKASIPPNSNVPPEIPHAFIDGGRGTGEWSSDAPAGAKSWRVFRRGST